MKYNTIDYVAINFRENWFSLSNVFFFLFLRYVMFSHVFSH